MTDASELSELRAENARLRAKLAEAAGQDHEAYARRLLGRYFAGAALDRYEKAVVAGIQQNYAASRQFDYQFTGPNCWIDGVCKVRNNDHEQDGA